jgi:hypothetical protein
MEGGEGGVGVGAIVAGLARAKALGAFVHRPPCLVGRMPTRTWPGVFVQTPVAFETLPCGLRCLFTIHAVLGIDSGSSPGGAAAAPFTSRRREGGTQGRCALLVRVRHCRPGGCCECGGREGELFSVQIQMFQKCCGSWGFGLAFPESLFPHTLSGLFYDFAKHN